MKRISTIAVTTTFAIAFFATSAFAQPRLTANPAVFVGTAEDCGGPAGARIVTSVWLTGMGLPDSGGLAHPAGNNPHDGVLMSKNGPTSNCSAAVLNIGGWTSGNTLHTLGFDHRLGGACGAGGPRINVYSGSTTYFFGCAHGNKSPAPQDPAQWERVLFNAAGAPLTGYPGAETFVWGVTPVDAIQVIFDEGTDTPTLPNNPAGIGLAVLDNIRINNTWIRQRSGNVIQP
jgi:hypothetical protein